MTVEAVMNQLALQFPGRPLAIREVSLWTVVRSRLTFLSVWAQSSLAVCLGPVVSGAGQGLEETFLVPDFGCESHR